MKRVSIAMIFLMMAVLGWSQKNKQPNIIVIISDDHAYQTISAYGSTYAKTPGIDRLAKEGALFTKGYVTNSICGPSRAAFLSGKYSNLNGFKDNESSVFNFDQNTFTKDLQRAGYQTAWIGKMHLGNDAPKGLDYFNILPEQGHYYNPDFISNGGVRKRYEGYVTNIITDLTENWLDGRDKNKPFCLVVGHKATHRTWMPDLPDLGRFDHQKFPLPSTFYDVYGTRKAASVQDMTISKTMRLGYDLKVFETAEAQNKDGNIKRMSPSQRLVWDAYYDKIKKEYTRLGLKGKALTEWKYQRYMKDYLATAYSLDKNIGEVLNYLDKNELTQNTIVIYMSDQGFYMGEHGWFDKRFMYEESFRTPLLMRYPGVIKPGTKISDMVLNIDLGPTLLEAAGTKVPADMHGQSILNLLKHQPYKGRKALFYHYYENGEHSVSPHFGIKTKRYKLIRFYKRVEGWELFDLQKDPKELHNIYNTSKGKQLAKQLKPELLKLIEQYQDEEAKTIFNQPL